MNASKSKEKGFYFRITSESSARRIFLPLRDVFALWHLKYLPNFTSQHMLLGLVRA